MEKTDGRPETKGCSTGATNIIGQLKDIWLNENYKNVSHNIVDRNGHLFLGGDHSITYEVFSNNPCEGLLIFDAHPDVYQEFSLPTHSDWLKFLVEDGKINAENVIIVGLRSFHKDEIDYLRNKKIKFLTMKNLYDDGSRQVCDSIMEFVSKFKSLYLSIDIDVVDPAFASGVGYIEPGGLTSRDLIYFVQRLKNLKNLKKVDIVEVNTDRDVNNMTAKLAAKLVYELI